MSEDRRNNPRPAHWVSQDDLHREILGLERRFEKRMEEFGLVMRDALSEVKRSVNAAMDRSTKPVNWGWIFAGFGVFAALLALWIGPVSEKATANTSALNELATNRFTESDGDRLAAEVRNNLALMNDRYADFQYWRGTLDADMRRNQQEIDLLRVWRKEDAQPEINRTHEKRRIDAQD